MSAKTSTSPINDLIGQFRLHEKLFANVTSDITDEKARKRMSEDTNHLAWLIGHTVSVRYMLLNALGAPASEPFPDLFAQGKGMQEKVSYPSVKELTRDWPVISQKLEEKLNSLTETELGANGPFSVPTGTSLRDFISFFAHHEAYTIGQMGLLRRFHGYPAMKY